MSIQKGVFPNELKIVGVRPIYKNNDETYLWNYSPISVLQCFSKILERIVYNRLYQHLYSNKMFYKNQLGFQKGLSTEQEKSTTFYLKSLFTLGVFIDLYWPFDTVDHDIICK